MFFFKSLSDCSKVHFEEKQSKCDVLNSERKKVGFTKGESTSVATKRCDYIIGLYVTKENESADAKSLQEVIFLELKGKNFKQAIRQVQNTVCDFADDFKKIKKKTAIIVYTSYPKIDTTFQIEKMKLAKQGIGLKKAEKKYEYDPKG